MTRGEAINVLKTRSCYECTWGCDSPVSCHCGGCDLAEATMIAIESLGAFGWIPVTERLPEDDTDVLCTIHFVGTHLGSLAREWLVDIGHCRDGEWYTYLDDDAIKDAWFDVVAWQPLPDCYEEEQK